MTDELPHCYRHPDRETGLSCSNCGNPICPDCSVDAVVGQRCLDCHKSIGTTRVERGSALAGALGPVTKALIAANVAVYLIGNFSPSTVDALVQWNQQIQLEGTWWTLVTSAFLHTQIWHIGLNMYALYILGPRIERQLGPGPFLGLYMLSAVTGGLGGYLLGGLNFAQLGASGAIYGLAGYMFWQWWPTRQTPRGREGWRFVLWLVGVGILVPMFIPNFISWQGHLGGLIGGLAVAAGWDIFNVKSRTNRMIFAFLPAVALLGVVALSVW